MRREQMTAVVSQITHYRCHCVMGISDKSVLTMPTMVVSGMRSSPRSCSGELSMMTTAVSCQDSLPMSWCHGYQRFVCTGDSDNGSERCKTFPEKLVWRDVDDDNSSELSSLITIVMSGHPAMTTVVTASLNTVVIKLNRIL
ncbi:MAG: hypothetical protein EOM34_14525 [Clostridia bacterium]|jgi:hypothetical protein|nr:hypothetical protein [Clostridia bacterium]